MLRAAALVLATTVLTAPAAHARADAIVDQADRSDDVNILDGGGSKPTLAQRQSIDLERFTVTRTAQGVRLSFQLRRVTGSRAYDQVVEAQLGRGAALLDVLANPRSAKATAYVEGDTACLVDVSTPKGSDTVRIDLPTTCLPHGSGPMLVTTYTQRPNGSGPSYSEDTLRIKGRVSLR